MEFCFTNQEHTRPTLSCATARGSWRTTFIGGLLLVALSSPAAAQEQLLFPKTSNVKSALVSRINAETVRVDIAVWQITEREISIALINRHKAGVPVRLLCDRASVFESDGLTKRELEYLATAGIPIRLRYHPRHFPETMHWKSTIFVGQGIVEFGSANYTPFELRPVSTTNYKDETALFTDDPDIVNAFMTQFDIWWADTDRFMDWPEAYQRDTGTAWTQPMTIDRTRLVGNFPLDIPGFIWGQGTELNNALVSEINKETDEVYLVSYRLTVNNITDALIRKKTVDNVPVRVIIEQTQYRNAAFPEYWLVGAMADRLWVAGVEVKQRVHSGLTHMKTLITSNVAMVASSNFTKNWQRDHNYLFSPASKPQLYNAMRTYVVNAWNDAAAFGPFQPQPPRAAKLVAPASGALNVAGPVKLEWERAPWAVAFDVYLGTSTSNMSRLGRVNAVMTETPPARYSFTASGLQPNTRYVWRVVSRTYATEVDPSLINTSSTFSFTTADGGGGGVLSPFNGTPAPVPGTVQAEAFDNGGAGVAYFDTTAGNSGGAFRATDVDLNTTSDTGGGYHVGWMKSTEWLKYTVNVASAGTYTLEFRVAAPLGGAKFHLEANGVNVTGPLTVPTTGAYNLWSTVTKTGVNLQAGTQVWTFVVDSPNADDAVANLNYIRAVAASTNPPDPPTGSTPFGGTAVALPGTVQAENFDEGGRNVAYVDTTNGNSGGDYRSTDVDIDVASDTGGGYYIGWLRPGEWLNYSVNVAAAGTYTLEVRLASSLGGARFHIEANGVNVTGPLTFPTTGSTQTWGTLTKTGVNLPAGAQRLRLVIDSTNANGGVGNINYFRITGSSSASSTPFGGTPAALPGLFQAENFDEGGRNVAYVDTTNGNSGGDYRATDVDIDRASDTGGGYYIGWLRPGEWLNYTVNVAAAGLHTLEVRLASSLGGARFHIEAGGVNVTGPLTFPTTGSTQTWSTLVKTGVNLAAGTQVWRLVIDSTNANGGVGNINYIRVTPQSTLTSAAATVEGGDEPTRSTTARPAPAVAPTRREIAPSA
jgi:phosphatidylserine/phosphatidylglycerophosphate/cardiolipin synthase-like enzyme